MNAHPLEDQTTQVISVTATALTLKTLKNMLCLQV